MSGRIVVIVLNWNGWRDTLPCLDSVLASRCPDLDVLVVDNGSADDSCARIRQAFPHVRLVETGRNLGWAGGNNAGMRLAMEAGAQAVVLLNNDTVVEPDTFQALADAALATGPALLQPRIYFAEAPATAQLNPMPDVAADAPTGDLPQAVPMDYAYGACLYIPAAVIRKVGYLDERFFLQLEETDYYHRCRGAGFGTYCAMRARMLHKESASFGGPVSPLKSYYISRNLLLLSEKHLSALGGPVACLRRLYRQLRGLAERDAGPQTLPGFFRWLAGGSSRTARAVRGGMLDYARRRFGPCRRTDLG